MKLLQHSNSGLFTNFQFNNVKEIFEYKTKSTEEPCSSNNDHILQGFSIWEYLGKHNYEFINPVYNIKKKTILFYPKQFYEFELWREVYCCTPAQTCINDPVF